jgi:hypothetical protein
MPIRLLQYQIGQNQLSQRYNNHKIGQNDHRLPSKPIADQHKNRNKTKSRQPHNIIKLFPQRYPISITELLILAHQILKSSTGDYPYPLTGLFLCTWVTRPGPSCSAYELWLRNYIIYCVHHCRLSK